MTGATTMTKMRGLTIIEAMAAGTMDGAGKTIPATAGTGATITTEMRMIIRATAAGTMNGGAKTTIRATASWIVIRYVVLLS
eukprot:g3476.t1